MALSPRSLTGSGVSYSSKLALRRLIPVHSLGDPSAFPVSAKQEAKEAANDPSMVGGGVKRIYKGRFDSVSTYLHCGKKRKDSPTHVLDVSSNPHRGPSEFPGFFLQ